MSKGFDNRFSQNDDLPEFYAICDRILGIPGVFEMTPPGYKDRMEAEVENAKGDQLAMAKCMRELQATVFVLKTSLVSNSPTDILENGNLIESGSGFEAYKFLQQKTRKSDPDVEAANIFIGEQEGFKKAAADLMDSVIKKGTDTLNGDTE